MKLLQKEFRLCMHPTTLLFLALSAMLIIPNYPYYVTFFYTTLGIFFVCLTGRENNDIEYSMMLPVRKRSIVWARMMFCVLTELAQVILAVPFAILRGTFPMGGNNVGMDANTAFFGIALLMLGVFNLLFFTRYYRSPDKVGKTFAVSSVVFFVLIAAAEAADHIWPFMRDVLDTPDPANMGAKLIVLGAGAAAFALLTLCAYRVSAKRFEKLDI